MTEEVHEAAMPGEWEMVPTGVPHLIPNYDQDLIPEEPVDPNYRLEVDPVFQHVYKQSLAPYFDRLSSTIEPCSKVIWNKNEFLQDELKESRTELSEPLVVWNNNCIIRTNKKELLESQDRRRKEDREFERSLRGGRAGGFGGRGRGRGGGRGGGFSRSRYNDRSNPNEVQLGERKSSRRSRSRSPLLPKSYDRRSTSSRKDSRERSSSSRREGSRRDSYGDRRDSKRSRTDSESSYERPDDRRGSRDRSSTHSHSSYKDDSRYRESSRRERSSDRDRGTYDDVFAKPDYTPDRIYNRERSSSYKDRRESRSPSVRSSPHARSSHSSYHSDYDSPFRSAPSSYKDNDRKEDRRKSEIEGIRPSSRESSAMSSTPMTYGEYKRRKELQHAAGSSRH